MTPPSRTTALGSALIARAEQLEQARRAAQPRRQLGTGAGSTAAQQRAAARAAAPASRASPARSRGRAVRSAMRAVMRSTSAARLSSARAAPARGRCRWRRPALRSRPGAPRRPRDRAAGGAAHAAAAGCPCWWRRCPAATAAWARLRRAGSRVISRLRRRGGIQAQICRLALDAQARARAPDRRPGSCGSTRAARRRRPAPGPSPRQPKPDQIAACRTASCSARVRRVAIEVPRRQPLDAARRSRRAAGRSSPSGSRTSAGPQALQLATAGARGAVSSTRKSPEARLSQAMPEQRFRRGEREQQVVALVVQQRGVGQRARA